MKGCYAIEFSALAARQYRKLELSVQQQLKPFIDALEKYPFPKGFKKLKGVENGYRIRVGDYRILYKRIEERLVILIVKVAHRSKAY